MNANGVSLQRGFPIGILEPSADRLAELNRVFEDEYRSLIRFAHFLTGDPGTAEDLVQEAFVRMYRAVPRLADANLKAYARKTILNLSRSAHARRQMELRATTSTTHEPVTEQRDIAAADEIWRAIMTLSPKQRACVALRYYEAMSEAEIAAALSMSAGSVKKHSDRAMSKLRVLLGEGRLS